MLRTLIPFALFATCCSIARSQSDKAAVVVEAEDPAPIKTPRERVQADPNDVKAWDAYWGEQYRVIVSLLESDPKGAERWLAEIETLVRDHEPTSDMARKHVALMKGSFASLRKSLAFFQIPLADLEQQLAANPDDLQTLANYQRKAKMELAPLAQSDAAKATEQLAAVRATLQKAKEAAKDKKAKDAIDAAVNSLASIDRDILASRAQSDIVGQTAAPLNFEAWVNGKPMTEADLKGKVIILDFWAVWCGPCIATFPHLREWHEQYGEKGLVIVGVTKYYNFKWDEANKKAAKVDEEVSPEDEQAMLVKFAESHKLKHRFAIQESSELNDFYRVRGIPQIVVIDQQNKVQLIRVGSGEENAKAVSDVLKKLLGDKPAAEDQPADKPASDKPASKE